MNKFEPASAMGLLYTTWPDGKSAETAAEAMLAEGLIACANILGQSHSIFHWDGKIQHEREVVALFKTSSEKAQALRDRLAALHPYDEPCILDLSVSARASTRGFLAWVNEETDSPPR